MFLKKEAWDYYWLGEYDMALRLVSKVIDQWAPEARELNAKLDAFPSDGLRTTYVALNEVGTCYWIRGESLRKQGDLQGAMKAYNTLVDEFGYAQCWNHQGWWWKPGDAARKVRDTLGQ